MKSIPSEYIKTFIPIQELDELTAASGQLVTIHPDDLFLMSQISAYSSKSSNAIALSKKINYKNFSERLSNDFSIEGLKLSVTGKIQPIYDLSSQLRQTSTYLSDSINISVSTLKTTINNVSSSLSNTVRNNYIQNYGTQICSLIDRLSNPANSTRLATRLELENGKIAGIEKDDLSNLLLPKDWHIAYGGIAANDVLTSYTVTVSNSSGAASIQQNILSDCYVNCMLSVKEDDSCDPLQVWISSSASNASALYATLNNPGGFSGKDYYNYYNVLIPIKGLFGAKIILKYANSKYIKKDSSARFDCYYFYAVPSKDELSSYAKKSSIPASSPAKKVYEMTYGEGGIIQTATSVYYGAATNSNAGLVKVNKLFTTPKYGLMISSNGYGYVEVSSATSSTYGTIQYNYSTDSGNSYHNFMNVTSNGKHFLGCGLEKNQTGHALTFIPCASSTTFGVVKLNPNAISSSNDAENPLSTYLGVDSNGKAYVTIPFAHYDQYGYPIPGIVKPGYPDTTGLRIVRNIYLNQNGVACVNVANQIGVGPYAEDGLSGYNKCVTIPLNNSIAVSQFSEIVKAFNGQRINCSDYGAYVFSISDNINGWFMAQLMYESDGQTTYNSNNSGLQIICDGVIVTTFNPQYVKTAPGKKFMHSVQLGVFKGGSESGSRRIFGAISTTASFGNDKLHFLIKEMSNS